MLTFDLSAKVAHIGCHYYIKTLLSVTTACIEVRKKAMIRNRYNQVPHLTQDTAWESDKNTIKNNIQERKEVSPFPAGDHKAAMNVQDNMTNTKH